MLHYEKVLVVNDVQNIHSMSLGGHQEAALREMRIRCNAVARNYPGLYKPLTIISEYVSIHYDNEMEGDFTRVRLARHYRFEAPAIIEHDDYMRILKREHEVIMNRPNREPQTFETTLMVESFKDT